MRGAEIASPGPDQQRAEDEISGRNPHVDETKLRDLRGRNMPI
jgi:hypothetical protein